MPQATGIALHKSAEWMRSDKGRKFQHTAMADTGDKTTLQKALAEAQSRTEKETVTNAAIKKADDAKVLAENKPIIGKEPKKNLHGIVAEITKSTDLSPTAIIAKASAATPGNINKEAHITAGTVTIKADNVAKAAERNISTASTQSSSHVTNNSNTYHVTISANDAQTGQQAKANIEKALKSVALNTADKQRATETYSNVGRNNLNPVGNALASTSFIPGW